MSKKPHYFLSKDVVLRNETFGGLILCKNGKRYYLNKKHYLTLLGILGRNRADIFNDIRKIDEKSNAGEEKEIINESLALNILGTKKSNGKLIENKLIGAKTLTFPKIVYLEVTNMCNLNCKHCYSEAGEKKGAELSTTHIKQLITDLAKHGAEFLSIGGGEPLLRPDLNEIIKYSINSGIEVELVTNGTLIDREKIKELKKTGLKYIQVSLDGFNSVTYDLIRGKDYFDKVVSTIKKLSKNFIVTVSTVVTKINYKNIEKIVDLSEKSGAKYFRVVKLMSAGRAKKAQLFVSEQEIHNILNKLKKISLSKRKIAIEFDENLLQPKRKAIPWLHAGIYGCSAGRSTCNIDSIGNVYPCSFLQSKELLCGNIKEKQLYTIWVDSEILQQFRNITSVGAPCKTCNWLNTCLGGCRADAYSKTGKINGGNKNCGVKK